MPFGRSRGANLGTAGVGRNSKVVSLFFRSDRDLLSDAVAIRKLGT
jgi:hypothetical protein